jgi:hypothetical protein
MQLISDVGSYQDRFRPIIALKSTTWFVVRPSKMRGQKLYLFRLAVSNDNRTATKLPQNGAESDQSSLETRRLFVGVQFEKTDEGVPDLQPSSRNLDK